VSVCGRQLADRSANWMTDRLDWVAADVPRCASAYQLLLGSMRPYTPLDVTCERASRGGKSGPEGTSLWAIEYISGDRIRSITAQRAHAIGNMFHDAEAGIAGRTRAVPVRPWSALYPCPRLSVGPFASPPDCQQR
jgi:hypothetical protein